MTCFLGHLVDVLSTLSEKFILRKIYIFNTVEQSISQKGSSATEGIKNLQINIQHI